MRVWFKVFMSFRSDDHPDLMRNDAKDFANKVLETHEENMIINITESLNKWGTVITVWYKADVEVMV